MIAKSKRYHFNEKKSCIIYQRGIGYYFQTQYIFNKLSSNNQQNVLNDELAAILIRYTDMKKIRIWWWLYFKPQKVQEVIEEIINFNIPHPKKTETKEVNTTTDRPTEESFDDVYDIINNLCFYYAWSWQDVLENVSLIDVYELNKRISQSLFYEASLTAMAYHDPKSLNKMSKKAQGYEFDSINNYASKRKNDPKVQEARERARRNRELARQARENKDG